ncbi:MAG: flagellar motor switch protein FliG [Nitrospirae bacterium]|nr:MAG: flagellar motor switch protein FliG [Nitrospirota bacterium]
MPRGKLSGPEKAAILLLAMGEQAAIEVMKSLDPKDIRQIGQEMGGIVSVASEDHSAVMAEFAKRAAASGLSVEGKQFLTKVLTKALGRDKARRILASLSSTENAGFEALKVLDAASIANMLSHEHPQTGALILANLEADQAGQVLMLLPPKKREEVMYRMASTEDVLPSVLEELNNVIEEELRVGVSRNAVPVGGTGMVAEILNTVRKDVKDAVLSSLEARNEKLAEDIRSKMFVFEDLEYIDDRGMQELLREVSKEDLMIALRAADEMLKEKFFKNMSSRAAEALKEDMEAKGPAKVSDVEASQRTILKIAQKLAAEGRIILGGKDAEQMV